MPNGKIQPDNLKIFQKIPIDRRSTAPASLMRAADRYRLSHGASPPWTYRTVHLPDWTAGRLLIPLLGRFSRANLLADGSRTPFREWTGGTELDLSQRREDESDQVIALDP